MAPIVCLSSSSHPLNCRLGRFGCQRRRFLQLMCLPCHDCQGLSGVEGAETPESALIRSAIFNLDDPGSILKTERVIEQLFAALANSHVVTRGATLCSRAYIAYADSLERCY